MVIRKRSESELKALGYSDDSCAMYRRIAQEASSLQKEADDLEAIDTKESYLKSIRLRRKVHKLEYILLYGGEDPKNIPKQSLLDMARIVDWNDNIEVSARRAIRNRATAIRAMCILCMGGSYKLVRECETVNCPLWSFRLGKDPLRPSRKMKIDGKEVEVAIDEDIDETALADEELSEQQNAD